MSNFGLSALRKHGKHAVDRKGHLRHLVPRITLITAAAVSVSLVVAVGPAIIANRPPIAPIISVSGNGRPAVALRTVLNRVHRTGDGQFALASSGLSSQARTADTAFVASLDKLERQARAAGIASDNVIDAADTVLAAGQGTTVITLLPGVTLTISSRAVVLDISSQDVTDIVNAAALGSAIASLVGAILAVAQVPGGAAIASIVASSITVGSDAVRLCSGNDGGSIILSVSAPANELPIVSACGLSV